VKTIPTLDHSTHEVRCAQVYEDYLAAVQFLTARRQTLLNALQRQSSECWHAPLIARLRCFRGIDALSAARLCAEVGAFDRFPKPALLSGFLGIVPCEHTSDTRRRQGSITKASLTNGRRLLVQAAHHSYYPPRVGEALARPQDGRDTRIIEIA
jgi:transposase